MLFSAKPCINKNGKYRTNVYECKALKKMLNKVHTCIYTCNSLSGLGVLQNIPKKKNDIWKANVLGEVEK